MVVACHEDLQAFQGVWGEVRLGGGEEDAGKGGEEVGPVLGEAVLAVTLMVVGVEVVALGVAFVASGCGAFLGPWGVEEGEGEGGPLPYPWGA